MSKEKDPLGFDAIISTMKTHHSINPIQEDHLQDWNLHPVTIRLKQLLAIDKHQRLANVATPASAEVIRMYDTVIEDSLLEGEHANN